MFLEFNYQDNPIKHKANILKLLKEHPIYETVKDYNPIFAGGFPTALLLAPRTGGHVDRVWYKDIDLYFSSQKDFDQLAMKLELLTTTDLKETEWAKTYTINNYEVQLIRQLYPSGLEVIKGFDLVHCSFALDTSDKFFIHKDLISNHLNNVLKFNNPWMLRDDTNLRNIVTGLYRISKYCSRWSLDLDDEVFEFLYNLYQNTGAIPLHGANRAVRRSGGYDARVAGRINDAWEMVGELMKDHHLCTEEKAGVLDRIRWIEVENLLEAPRYQEPLLVRAEPTADNTITNLEVTANDNAVTFVEIPF